MRVDTFYFIVDYGYGDRLEWRNQSRVAVERLKQWYSEDTQVVGMLYGKEIKSTEKNWLTRN